MSDTRLRVALFGAGRIGQIHAHNIANHPQLELAVICAASPESAQRLAERYNSAAARDPNDIFTADNMDAIVIASPNSTHIELMVKAARSNIAVLCEKPIDLDLDRVRANADELMGAHAPLMIGFNRRFDIHFATLQKRIAAGEIGRLEQLTITSRDPAPSPKEYVLTSGGIFRDMTIHDFDMARFLVPDLVEVSAFGANVFSDYTRDAGDFDSALVVMRGTNDELVTIINSRHCAYGYDQRLEAFGSDGMLSAENILPTTIRKSSSDCTDRQDAVSSSFLDRYSAAYRAELDAFAAAVLSRSSASPKYFDGMRALELAYAAGQSAQSGHTMRV